jgi:hypothetical protein
MKCVKGVHDEMKVHHSNEGGYDCDNMIYKM